MHAITRRSEANMPHRQGWSVCGIALILVVAGLCSVALPSHAMPRFSRDIAGTVQSTGPTSLSLIPRDRSESMAFVWKEKRTKFIRDGSVVTIDSLAVGTQVQVRYRAPLFGPRIALRVVWQSP